MQEEVNSKLPDGMTAEVTATAEAGSGSGRRLRQSYSMVTYMIVVPIGPGMVRGACSTVEALPATDLQPAEAGPGPPATRQHIITPYDQCSRPLPPHLLQTLAAVSGIVSSTAMAAATDPIFLLALLTLAILIPGFDILAILAAIILSTSALVGLTSCTPC